MSVRTPLEQARHLVFKAQHDGRHEQDRHDAKVWMDEHGGGRCPCDRCVRDEAEFQARIERYSRQLKASVGITEGDTP